MPSTFSWLDHSEQQRRTVLDLLHLFKERETVDELGIGTIRDALADLLFPGTSAPQTRARYFLFVPWMYQGFEKQRTPSAEIGRKAKLAEGQLIEALLKAGESDGVIGRVAGKGLQRRPASIYWAGLRRLGILLREGSQQQYHASLDAAYRHHAEPTEDGERPARRLAAWHSRLPGAPRSFPGSPSLQLEPHEAEFLRDQLQVSAPDSLFAAIVREKTAPPPCEFPWDEARYMGFSPQIQRQLTHAQNLSEVMHGAALLYNLILSELTGNQEREQEYVTRLGRWASAVIAPRQGELAAWDLDDLWTCAEAEGARIGLRTRRFVVDWYQEAVRSGNAATVASRQMARRIVENRERAMKGRAARVDNQRARERWGGAAGTIRLSYRWSNAARIAADIVTGLNGDAHA